MNQTPYTYKCDSVVIHQVQYEIKERTKMQNLKVLKDAAIKAIEEYHDALEAF